MRLLIRVILALLVILILAINGVRWAGHRDRMPVFPMPSSDGCWQAICFLDAETLDTLLNALKQHPDVVQGSTALVMPSLGTGYNMVEFAYRANRAALTPVLLYWGPYGYNLVRDWRRIVNPPLLRAGDVITLLGPPASVGLVADQIELDYSARDLRVLVTPHERAEQQAHLLPGDPVVALQVTDTRSGPGVFGTSDASGAWHGFGLYRFGG